MQLYKLYKNLRTLYGKPSGQWSIWCKRPKTDRERERVMMEAILTQRTNWRNVEQAIAALEKRRLLSLDAFLNAYRKNPARTALLIKPSGFYQQKAARLAGLAAFVKKRYGAIAVMKRVFASPNAPASPTNRGESQGGPALTRRGRPLARMRTELLSLNGIGPETADSILLYALDKPIFVIDEYTRRFLQRRSELTPRHSKSFYENLQKFFQNNLKKDYRLYQDFHALIVIDGKVRR
mgnify:FL=1